MDCFAKRVGAKNDPAIKGEFSGPEFCPFTLLSLSGFECALGRAEASVVLDLMFHLLPAPGDLCISRIGDIGYEEFNSEADRAAWRPLPGVQVRASSRGKAYSVYRVSASQRSNIPEVLGKLWRTYYGHWLFVGWSAHREDMGTAFGALSEGYRDASCLRAAIFPFTEFVALTFDDKLFDLFAKADLESVLIMLESATTRNNVELHFTEEK